MESDCGKVDPRARNSVPYFTGWKSRSLDGHTPGRHGGTERCSRAGRRSSATIRERVKKRAVNANRSRVQSLRCVKRSTDLAGPSSRTDSGRSGIAHQSSPLGRRSRSVPASEARLRRSPREIPQSSKHTRLPRESVSSANVTLAQSQLLIL